MTDMAFRWAHDSWDSQQGTIIKYDKVEHALRGIAITIVAIVLGLQSPVMLAAAFALVWEIKDGFMDYKHWGWWGGEGFSWRDLCADIVGACTAYGATVLYILLRMAETP